MRWSLPWAVVGKVRRWATVIELRGWPALVASMAAVQAGGGVGPQWWLARAAGLSKFFLLLQKSP